MLNLTDAARAHLANILVENGAGPDAAARVFINGNILGLGIDTQLPEDETFEHDGNIVLLVDPQIAALLGDRTLDVRETDEGTQLSLH